MRNDAATNKLLKALVIAGVISIAAVNPFFGVLASYVAKEELKKRERKRFQDNFNYLKRKGFVTVAKNSDGSYSVKPTQRGANHIKQFELNDMTIKTPRKWDGKWRMAVFDIPTEKQKGRSALLSNLRRLGFIKFQKSIWAHPFECHREVTKIAKTFEINHYVRILLCDEVSEEQELRAEFESRNNIKLSQLF